MRLLLYSFFFCYTYSSHAQQYRIRYSYSDEWKIRKISDSLFKSKEVADKYISDLHNSYLEKGYLLFSIDSNEESAQVRNVVIHLGPLFQEARLVLDSSEKVYLKRNGFTQENLKINRNSLKNHLKTILEVYLNNGYPFAKIQITDCKFSEKTRLVKYPLIVGKSSNGETL
jgi:outer membrane protein assembly factor BamA